MYINSVNTYVYIYIYIYIQKHFFHCSCCRRTRNRAEVPNVSTKSLRWWQGGAYGGQRLSLGVQAWGDLCRTMVQLWDVHLDKVGM